MLLFFWNGSTLSNKTKALSALVHTKEEIYQGCCLSRCNQRSSRSQGFSSQGGSDASGLGLLKNTISITRTVSVQFCCLVVSDSLWPHGLQHARPPCPSPTPRACSNSCLLSWWCHPTISSSVAPFCSHPQSFPASGSFQMSQLFPQFPDSFFCWWTSRLFTCPGYSKHCCRKHWDARISELCFFLGICPV